MISTALKLLFLHIPKTGGNSVQELLLPFSDDRRVLRGHQDGIDRFEVKGAITPHKHATFADYAGRLDLDGFKVIATCRNPVDRALSFYFSPHRWFSGQLPIAPVWNFYRFVECLDALRPAVDFIAGADDVHLLRFERLREDVAGLNDLLNVKLPALPHRNATAGAGAMIEEARLDPAVTRAVYRRFAGDFDAFGYQC